MRPLYDCFKEEKSEVDKLFEELGYAKQKNKKYIRYYIKYGLFIPDSIIEFNLYNKWVNVNFNLDMLELQAINEKVKELGWLDE